MSELTPCNFCNLRRMREQALKHGMVVTTRQQDSRAGTRRDCGGLGLADAATFVPIDVERIKR